MRLEPDPSHTLHPDKAWLWSFVDWSERTPARDEAWEEDDYAGLGPDSCDFGNFFDFFVHGDGAVEAAPEDIPEDEEAAEEEVDWEEV